LRPATRAGKETSLPGAGFLEEGIEGRFIVTAQLPPESGPPRSLLRGRRADLLQQG